MESTDFLCLAGLEERGDRALGGERGVVACFLGGERDDRVNHGLRARGCCKAARAFVSVSSGREEEGRTSEHGRIGCP